MISKTSQVAAGQVTVQQFREFVNKTGYLTECEQQGGGWVAVSTKRWVQKPDASWDNPYKPQEEDDPVVLITGLDAIFFANWKSLSEGLVPAYTIVRNKDGYLFEYNRGASGYRLPTKAECDSMYVAVTAKGGSQTRRAQKKLSAAYGLSTDGLLYWCWEDAAQKGIPKLCFQGMGDEQNTLPAWLTQTQLPHTASIVNVRLSRDH